MTTIAAIQGPDWVMIGADSQSSDEDGFAIMIPNGKIFKNNNIVFAMAGSVRGINILEHDFIPPQINGKDIDKYVTRQLIPAIRNSFLNAGYEFSKDGPVEQDSVTLVIVKGNIYRINEDYSWERSADNMYVAGSGEKFALGAMAALSSGSLVDDPVKARKIITKAVQIASKYDSYTGGKITVTLVQESK
jgi:ATP-dependent protease HslVU (ClpYQ) peptidase subunit